MLCQDRSYFAVYYDYKYYNEGSGYDHRARRIVDLLAPGETPQGMNVSNGSRGNICNPGNAGLPEILGRGHWKIDAKLNRPSW